ncbi:hypothetical protein RIF29_02364 [Crotalaria pallida]|uniref:Uncharacterized protein n=1 Tax=Crotalaria pallida TaxID=3830 RepID=A0AAN9IYH2_CROPI
MWSESRLAKRMRRYLMLPFACLPLAMRGVVHLIALCLANVSACEWRSGWLCCLAPCSWFGTSSMQPFSCTPCAGVPRCSLVVLVLPTHLAVSVCREDPFLPRPLVECRSCYPIGGGNICTSCIVVNGFYLVDPASSHMLVSKIKPCMYKRSTQALPVALMIHDNSSDRTAFVPATHHSNFCPINFRCYKARSWTLGWVDRSAYGVHRSARPFCRRCAPGLNWPGRASGAVTLKKLECSKQAYALDTLAWDNTTGF